MQIASYIDHTILKPTTTHIEIKKICEEALFYKFAAVCVPPSLVSLAKGQLSGSPVKTATVIGFPFGYSVIKAKLAEAEQAISDGADELDMVINLVALKEGDWEWLEKEGSAITDLAHSEGKIVKMIIESGVLTGEEIVLCCRLYGGIGVDFVKTSTGYGFVKGADGRYSYKGATDHDLVLMRKYSALEVQIKAAGGIRTLDDVLRVKALGVTRIGATATAAIIEDATKRFAQTVA